MDKLRMQTLDGVQDNIDKIAALFPNCITERKDAEDKVTLAIDFDKLRQELSSEIVEGREERYQTRRKQYFLLIHLSMQRFALVVKRVLILIIRRIFILKVIILMY